MQIGSKQQCYAMEWSCASIPIFLRCFANANSIQLTAMIILNVEITDLIITCFQPSCTIKNLNYSITRSNCVIWIEHKL